MNTTNEKNSRKTSVGHKRAFISYSSKEIVVADQVCEFLEEHGITCWIAPRDVNPGGNYATQIVNAIHDCEILVLLASEETNISNHVSNEVGLAFESNKVIIPFKIEDVNFTPEYRYFLGRKHWIEAHRDMKSGLRQLLSTVKSIIGDEQKLPLDVPTDDDGVPNPPPPETKPPGFDARQPEEPDIALTREEIANHILEKAGKHANNLISQFVQYNDFEEKKRLANSFLQEVFTVYRYGKRIEKKDYIDYLVSEILGDDDAEVIKISGLPGSGKGILIQSSFYLTLQEFVNGNSNYLPFYISLGFYEKARYNEDYIYDQVKGMMANDMEGFFAYCDKNNVIPIVFVDEIREHQIGKVSLENILMDILKEHDIYKRVVAVDSGLIKNRSRIKRIIPIISERVSATFEANVIDSHNEERARRFIENVLAFFKCNVSVEELSDTIKRLKYQEIDIFVVRSIGEELLSTIDEVASISEMYERWALTEFYGDEEKLLEVSETTFGYIFDKTFNMENIRFNCPHWALVHNHHTFLSMLISYYLINRIEKCDGQESSDGDIFKFMLTSSTDMFASGFLEENYHLQEKIYNIIVTHFESFGVIQKSSAVFWLAKLTNRNLVLDATRFLKEKHEVLKQYVKNHDNTTKENYDHQFLFRAMSFALILFGQRGVLDDYLCLLITNDSAHAINRGAMIEYYSDHYQMAANESYYLDTNITVGARAIKALQWKVAKSLQSESRSYPEIDMFSLSSLLQFRMQSNESKKVPELHSWISNMVSFIEKYKMRSFNVNSDKIKFYFSSIYNDFQDFLRSEDGFDISQILYNTLRNMKDTKRKQWTEKSIEDPESVSEHSYSAWLLAMLFLPDELNYDKYSKREILDMLLIHDIAESILGDQLIALNEPTKDLKEQNAVMREFMVKGSYPNIANLTYYYNVWTGYYNGVNINAKIARDINLVQTVYTFYEYNIKHPECFSEEDKEYWKREKEKLETDIGYSIYEKLVENNLDFEKVITNMVK